jgi:membrane-associated phospholipid phosphatase
VNLRVNKVSAHATAGSALMVYLAWLPPFSTWIFPMGLIFLLILASRALLKAHSLAELITGAICGTMAAVMVLWLR